MFQENLIYKRTMEGQIRPISHSLLTPNLKHATYQMHDANKTLQ